MRHEGDDARPTSVGVRPDDIALNSRSTNRPKQERRAGNALRERLRAGQGNRCFWCNVELEDAAWGFPRPPRSVTLDHVEPRSIGGELNEANCVAACHACNERRAAEFNSARGRLRSLIDRTTDSMSPAEIELRLGRVATAIQVQP